MSKNKINLKRKFACLILFFLTFSLVIPLTVLAGPLDSIGKFTTCTGTGIIAGQTGPYIQGLINDGVNKLVGIIPKIGGFLSGSLGGGAVPVVDQQLIRRYQAKEYTQDIIARCAAREILTAMNKNILNVARTAGRDGGASFVRNWRNFILDSQYRGEDIWRGLLYVAANGESDIPPLLCDHIKNSSVFISLQPKKVDNLTGSGINRRVGTQQEYLVATKCDSVVNEKFNTFMNDFSAGGGWDTFERLLQPQNNIYGAVGLALEELGRQRSIEEKADINEALAGGGFTSIRGTSEKNSSCVIAGLGGSCIVYKDIKTPGNVILGGVNATTEQELAFVANADELNEVIATALEVLFNRMLDLGNPNEGNYQIPGSVNFDPNSLPFPEPLPTEEPGPPPGQEPTSLLSDLQAERQNYGTSMIPQEFSNLLNAVAWKNRDNGWGLLSKPGGNRCPFVSGDIACDILFHRPSGLHYDVLIDAGVSSTPTWQLAGPMSASRWLAPVQP